MSKQITIKALRGRGGCIEWTYDNPQQYRKFWRTLCDTGAAPDTGELLSDACYFVGDSILPAKEWRRPSGGA